MLRREGWAVNLKCVRRIYRLEGLPLRVRVRRRKQASLHRKIPPAAACAHKRWSRGFIPDALIDGRTFRVLTVVDQWSRFKSHPEGGSRNVRDGCCRYPQSGDRAPWQTEDDHR